MPELPEVETITRRLQHVVGKHVVDVRVPSPKIVKEPSRDKLTSALKGARIERARRRAKHIIIETDRGTLLIHLKLTGTLDAIPNADAPDFLRFELELDDGNKIAFADRRHLGEVRLVDDAGVAKHLGKLGPEPWDAKPDLLVAQKRPIKVVLMDQEVLAGVGNIYADEALFLAKMHPLRTNLDDTEASALLKCVLQALEESLEMQKDEQPIRWRYLDDGPSPFRVYDREGEPCKRCNTTLVALRVGGRTTVICPHCQPAPTTTKTKAKATTKAAPAKSKTPKTKKTTKLKPSKSKSKSKTTSKSKAKSKSKSKSKTKSKSKSK